MERKITFLIFILILLFGICLESVFIVEDWKKKLKKAAWFKGLASLCFTSLGAFLVYINPSAPGWFIFLGLILGMTGDICLAVKKFLSGFISAAINVFGILSFMAGHFFYINALIFAGKINFKLALLLWPVVYLIVIPVLLIHAKGSPLKNRIMGCIYLSVVTFMFSTSVAHWTMQRSSFSILFSTGAFLFLISDVITIYNSLLPEKPKVLRAINLSLYYTAQILISLSILFF